VACDRDCNRYRRTRCYVRIAVAQVSRIRASADHRRNYLPGADAVTIEQSVATPIEQQMSGVVHMMLRRHDLGKLGDRQSGHSNESADNGYNRDHHRHNGTIDKKPDSFTAPLVSDRGYCAEGAGGVYGFGFTTVPLSLSERLRQRCSHAAFKPSSMTPHGTRPVADFPYASRSCFSTDDPRPGNSLQFRTARCGTSNASCFGLVTARTRPYCQAQNVIRILKKHRQDVSIPFGIDLPVREVKIAFLWIFSSVGQDQLSSICAFVAPARPVIIFSW